MAISEDDITKADIAKIHSEINQILNQRYSFIAIAITIFGFFVASFNFKEKLNITIPHLDNGCLITIVFLFIFSTLNYFISILTRQFHILRNYLIIKEISNWEQDYSKFISKYFYVGYTKSLRVLLLILGILMLLISFCDKYSNTKIELNANSDFLGPIIYLIAGILYYISLYWLTDKLAKNVSEDTIKSNWEKIDKTQPADSKKKMVDKTNTIMKPRISVFTLGVADLEKSVAFYRDGLGLKTDGIIGKEFEYGSVAFFELQNGLKLALWPKKSISKDANIIEQSPSSLEFTIGHNVNSKEEVDLVMKQAEKAGAGIIKPAQDTFYGGYAGYFQDPDGHLWEVVWNPAFETNE